MHLFLIDLFISIDTLSPIINELNRKKVIICNINPIQDHNTNKLIKYFIKKKIKYFNFLPIEKKKIILHIFIKLIIKFPCPIQKKLRLIMRSIYLGTNLSSKKKIEEFLIRNKIKSITYEESAPPKYIKDIYEVAKKLKIVVIKMTCGLNTENKEYFIDQTKINFCDKVIFPNKIPKVINKNAIEKIEFFGSLRYSLKWIHILSSLDKKKELGRKKVLGFFKKYQSKESQIVEKLIKKLKKNNKFTIISREKPRDIFPSKCNKFENDFFSSSQLIILSDFILTSRPSSILIEALLIKKKIILLNYANKVLTKSPFNKSKAFIKVHSEKNVFKVLNTKNVKNYEKNRNIFLDKFLLDWKNSKLVKNRYINLYNLN